MATEISAEKAKELNEVIKKVYEDLINYKNNERKILFNVENLYQQLRFLRYNQEKWGFLVVKSDRLQRIEATTEEDGRESLG